MQQFQIAYADENSFRNYLNRICAFCEIAHSQKVLFHIFTESLNEQHTRRIMHLIQKKLPEALIAGASTNGNILDGRLSGSETVVSCSVFEKGSTVMETFSYSLTQETESQVTAEIIQLVEKRPWVRAVEILGTIHGMSMTLFCKELSRLRQGVIVFGGAAFSEDINAQEPFVLRNTIGCLKNGIVLVLYGGEDLHFRVSRITGWKPLGRDLEVTRTSGNYILEVDGKPAYDTYYHYLKINNDENFFKNILEFPLMYQNENGYNLRVPVSCTSEGALELNCDMETGTRIRLGYGNPWNILDNIESGGRAFQEFQPEALFLFSCAARKFFWGGQGADRETEPFQTLAPSFGFYTYGEFIREGGLLNIHNETLVIAALREGETRSGQIRTFSMEREDFAGQSSIINRFAAFVEATTAELEQANELLALQGKIDGLTGLYNRKEIQHRINYENTCCPLGADPEMCPSVIMMDIDDFKIVNDTYGHREGDRVLIGLSGLLQELSDNHSGESSAGRWGGEEFMILLPRESVREASALAEKIRSDFSAIEFPQAGHCTLSLGVARMKPGENVDAFVNRADELLYQAKRAGKNRVVEEGSHC